MNLDRPTLPAPPMNGDEPPDLLAALLERMSEVERRLGEIEVQLEPIMKAIEESANRTLEVHQQNVEILRLLKKIERKLWPTDSE